MNNVAKVDIMPGRMPKTIQQIEKDNSRTRYTKAEIEARKELTPSIDRATLRVPAWLDETAKKEWRRIIRLSRGSGIYTDLDTNALGMYCKAFSRAMEAYAEYDKLKERVLKENPDANLMITKDKRPNPLLKIAMEAEDQCRKWSAILGIDPVSRARIGIARKKAVMFDPLDDLLNDVEDFVNGSDV